MTTVCLVGAGNIAQVHAQALGAMPLVTLAGVVDPNRAAAEALAARWQIPRVFASSAEVIASGLIDRVHVLTPPDRHAETALPFLDAGIAVLLEKPLAVSSDQCRRLEAAAQQGGGALGVNQNFVHHPAFVRLRRIVDERRLGRLISVRCDYNVALRQLAARQFSHWMFAAPLNLLLEQAVHPLSQIVVLAGAVSDNRALAAPPVEISPGVPFHHSVDIVLRCARAPADLRFAVGQSFPVWQVAALCDDGVAIADIVNNRVYTAARTRWIEMVDGVLSGLGTSAGLVGGSLRNAADFVSSTVRLTPRNDGFYRSIAGSIGSFHAALDDRRTPELDGAFGAHLVAVCENVATNAFPRQPSPKPIRSSGAYDILVLGGTGFIGTALVRRLSEAGQRVGVMARHTTTLGPVFFDEGVVVIQGDARDPVAVGRAIAQARVVINLAHGGGGASFAEIRDAMVGSAGTVAQACLDHRVERLIHVGSIASLYLGRETEVVSGATPPDPQASARADYARAKAECDTFLMAMQARDGLPVCLLRPGLVVGDGGLAAHSGLGVFTNEQHCTGWNQGTNPLPFVLVDDVAEAVWLATRAPGLTGRAFNLVGDVRLSARDYVAELGQALERPLRFHPADPNVLWAEERIKWLIKRATGRTAEPTSRRDLLSRGMRARFDCADVKAALGWTPVADRPHFIARGILVHARP